MGEHVRNKYTLAAVALAVLPFLAFIRSSAVTHQSGSGSLKLLELSTTSSWLLMCSDHKVSCLQMQDYVCTCSWVLEQIFQLNPMRSWFINHLQPQTLDSNFMGYLASHLCWRSISQLKHEAFSLLGFPIMLSEEKLVMILILALFTLFVLETSHFTKHCLLRYLFNICPLLLSCERTLKCNQ